MNYALQDEKGQHLGFLLMVADEVQSTTGACLIRALPESAELFHSDQVTALRQLQEKGELLWNYLTYKTAITNQEGCELAYIKEDYLHFGTFIYQLIDLVGVI